MRYAKSIYGVIVDSENAGYKDYVHWLLRCPKCGEPVHLVGASKRREHERRAPKTKQMVKVREAEVSSSFAHFKGLANEQCEDFNKAIDFKYISVYQSKSKQQRLEIFNNHFLDIIGYSEDNKGLYFTLFKSANSFNNKLAKRAYDAIVADYYVFICNSRDFSEAARALIESARGQLDCYQRKESYYSDFIDFVNTLDIDMHVSVLREVHKFLKTAAARKISTQIFDYSFARFIQASTDDECRYLLTIANKSDFQVKQDFDNLLNAMGKLFYQSLIFVDWYGEVQRISAH